jgi:parallel beta-helix repeat protein
MGFDDSFLCRALQQSHKFNISFTLLQNGRKTMMKRLLLIYLLVVAGYMLHAQPDIQKQLQRKFVDAEDNTVIEIPEGSFALDATLWLDGVKQVTIRGAGMDKTKLNFAGQLSGAEGIKITNAANITLQDLTVQNTKGDGIKTQQVTGMKFLRVRTEWTNGPDEKNGGYGLYPVQCNHVLIDSCEATGASDAGIYVGQSNHIIVRNSKAWQNVAGIEIENSTHADVYQNEAWDNTGGLLIFDLPDLVQKKGGNTRAFNNYLHDNNHANFAPKGNIVGKVPPGTGIMILATNQVEIFENKIFNNISVGLGIISYYITENPIKDSAYYPYPTGISIHNNHFERPHVRATGKGRMGKMFRYKLRFGKQVPHIIYDGIADEKQPPNICIRNNTNETFANIQAANNFKGISRNLAPYNCKTDALPAAKINMQ